MEFVASYGIALKGSSSLFLHPQWKSCSLQGKKPLLMLGNDLFVQSCLAHAPEDQLRTTEPANACSWRRLLDYFSYMMSGTCDSLITSGRPGKTSSCRKDVVCSLASETCTCSGDCRTVALSLGQSRPFPPSGKCGTSDLHLWEAR